MRSNGVKTFCFAWNKKTKKQEHRFLTFAFRISQKPRLLHSYKTTNMPAVPYTFITDKLSEWSYKAPTPNNRGGLSVYVKENQSSNDSPEWQNTIWNPNECDLKDCPTIGVMPFGVRDPIAGSQNTSRLSCPVTIPDPSQAEVYRQIDEHNIQTALACKETWFPKRAAQLTEAKIREMYRSLLYQDPEGKYCPSLQVKVNLTGKNATKVWMYEGKDWNEQEQRWVVKFRPGDISEIRAYDRCLATISVNQLYFQKHEFGMALTISEMLVYQENKSTKTAGFYFPADVAAPQMVQCSASSMQDDDDDCVNPLNEGALDMGGSTNDAEMNG